MNFTIVDTLGLLAAITACGLLLVAPGYALARLFGVSGDTGQADWLTGVVVGLATFPALDSVVARLCGLDSALAANLVLAMVAAVLALRSGARPRPTWVGLALLGGWLVILVVEWVDFDVAGKLYQPLTIFDAVKHAATAQAIYDSGAPPRDAFFLRPERASYYYFFYTVPALVMRLCGALVDAKAAVGGMAFWTGVGVYGLIKMALRHAGLAVSERRLPLLIVAVLAAGGLDILAMVYFAATRHYWVADPLQWNDVQVGAWFEDVLWVPHHVAALIAGMVGFIVLSEAASDGPAPPWQRPRRVVLAGICFAASLGLSIWVSLGIALTAGTWGLILLVERRWRGAGALVLSGLVALLVALPQILDIRAGRAGGGDIPIAVAVRPFLPIQLLVPQGPFQLLGNLLALPLNYGLEFGIIAFGSFVFWRWQRQDTAKKRQDMAKKRQGMAKISEFHRVLVIAALTGLFVGTFLRSTLFNNDLGWRVLLLPLLAGTVWTIVVVDRWIDVPRAASRPIGQPVFITLMGLGWATVLYTAVSMRAYPFMTVNPSARFIAADPETERGLRVAYDWASHHLPPSTVVQQNPTLKRAFAFGVYGRNPIGVADAYGSLYGADPRAVAARIAALGPIFKTDLPTSEIGARASGNGIDDLIVTAADPVWSQPESFVWRVKPVFASPRVRIIPVVTIEAAR